MSNIRYQDLANYVKEFGHNHVLQRYTPNQVPGYWIHRLRKRRKGFQNGKSQSDVSEDLNLLVARGR